MFNFSYQLIGCLDVLKRYFPAISVLMCIYENNQCFSSIPTMHRFPAFETRWREDRRFSAKWSSVLEKDNFKNIRPLSVLKISRKGRTSESMFHNNI